MRPGSYHSPGLAEFNGKVDRTLSRWRKEDKERKKWLDAQPRQSRVDGNRKPRKEKV